jgi:hypothetical protein
MWIFNQIYTTDAQLLYDDGRVIDSDVCVCVDTIEFSYIDLNKSDQ